MAPPRAWLWQRDDLLAPPARLAAGGCPAPLHRVLLDRLGDADQIDWSRACIDSALAPAKKGGPATGPNPTDRGKAGTKRHLLADCQGIPLALDLTAAASGSPAVSIPWL